MNKKVGDVLLAFARTKVFVIVIVVADLLWGFYEKDFLKTPRRL